MLVPMSVSYSDVLMWTCTFLLYLMIVAFIVHCIKHEY